MKEDYAITIEGKENKPKKMSDEFCNKKKSVMVDLLLALGN